MLDRASTMDLEGSGYRRIDRPSRQSSSSIREPFWIFLALSGLFETFAAWFHTGVESAGHEKTAYQIGPMNYYWVALMARYEWPALLGLALSLRYVAPSDARLRYIAIYGCGVLLAYSLIPYKTPGASFQFFGLFI